MNNLDRFKSNHLEWCTNGENQIHAYKLGLNKYSGKSGKLKIKIKMILDGVTLKVFDSISDASRETNIKNIAMVVRGERKSAGGYNWEKESNL